MRLRPPLEDIAHESSPSASNRNGHALADRRFPRVTRLTLSVLRFQEGRRFPNSALSRCGNSSARGDWQPSVSGRPIERSLNAARAADDHRPANPRLLQLSGCWASRLPLARVAAAWHALADKHPQPAVLGSMPRPCTEALLKLENADRHYKFKGHLAVHESTLPRARRKCEELKTLYLDRWARLLGAAQSPRRHAPH